MSGRAVKKRSTTASGSEQCASGSRSASTSSVRKELANTKRHPTVGDDVVIYANATILGGDTVIGDGSRIGGNVWLTRSVPAHSVVTPAARVDARTRNDELLEFNL